MSATDSLHGLNDCGCYEGISPQTPALIDNRPGVTAIAYRVGTHNHFKQTMLAGLSLPNLLQGLRARADDDFTIALLDGWATSADVLTFYQERIANELYLRTARETTLFLRHSPARTRAAVYVRKAAPRATGRASWVRAVVSKDREPGSRRY